LDIGLPKDKVDLKEFVRIAVPKLTEIEFTEENLPSIVEALKGITDKEWAKNVAWGEPETTKEETEEDLANQI